MSKQVILKLHSTQRLKELGSGSISKAIPNGKNMTDEELDAVKKQYREAQKLENEEYKRKISAGEQVPRRFFKKGEAIPSPQDIPVPTITEVVRTPFELRLDSGTGNTMYMIGSTKQGKSTALMKIYDRYYADRKTVSILWTDSPQIALYRSHHNLIVADRWNEDAEKIVLTQHRIQTRTKNNYRFLNMFDDIPHVRGSKVVEKMFMTYRNSKMSTIISMQACNQMPKNCRANLSNVLLFGVNNDESAETVIKCYLTGYLRKIGVRELADQILWYHMATENHAFILIHPASGSVSFHRFQL